MAAEQLETSVAEGLASASQAAAAHDLSALVIPLLKGVIYQDADAGLWNALLTLQARVRDYVAVLNLELVFDEAEGYASCARARSPTTGLRRACHGWSPVARCRFRSA